MTYLPNYEVVAVKCAGRRAQTGHGAVYYAFIGGFS
jgi:hypothetical protein